MIKRRTVDAIFHSDGTVWIGDGVGYVPREELSAAQTRIAELEAQVGEGKDWAKRGRLLDAAEKRIAELQELLREKLASAASERDTALREAEALRADAERYKRIRNAAVSDTMHVMQYSYATMRWIWLAGEALDQAIDAARGVK